jgi:hypothetical protein
VTQDIDDNTTSLLHLDRRDNTIGDNITLKYGRANSIAAAGKYIWLTLQAPNGKAGGVAQIDRTTRKFLRFMITPGYPLEINASPEDVWMLEQDIVTTHFDRIDPETGNISAVPATVQSSDDLQLFARFTVNASGLWATPQQPHANYIFHIDARSGKTLETIKLNDYPTDVTASDQAVYIALKNNTMVSLVPGQNTVSNPVSLPAPINWLAYENDAVWAWSNSASTAYQYEPHTNKLLGSALLGSTPVPTAAPTIFPTMSIMGRPTKPCDTIDFESNLRPGMKAVVNPDPPLPDRVRDAPSKTGKVVDVVPSNKLIDILEGPACAEGRVWWRVHTPNNLYGWTAEGDGIDHWLLPAPTP